VEDLDGVCVCGSGAADENVSDECARVCFAAGVRLGVGWI